jgi:uncharacterized damage-inducible protein DinB
MASVEEMMAQMEKTPDEFVALIRGQNEAILAKRPDGKNWAAKEIICHMRDTDELFMSRFQAILTIDEPKFSPADADRWAEDRQYLRNDVQEALAAFRRRRGENLKILRGLKPEQWERAGIHATRGRETLRNWVTLMANHDINHLEQLKRAFTGQP